MPATADYVKNFIPIWAFYLKVILYFYFHLVLSIVLQQYLRIYISFFLTSWHKLAICYNSFANCKKCNNNNNDASAAVVSQLMR